MQLFRFVAALSLIVAVSLAGIALEKRNLALQRAISLQQYRTDQLLERQANLRLQINELTSPMRAADGLTSGGRVRSEADGPEGAASTRAGPSALLLTSPPIISVHAGSMHYGQPRDPLR